MIRELLREAAANPWRTLADLAGLLLLIAALAAIYIMLWGMQP